MKISIFRGVADQLHGFHNKTMPNKTMPNKTMPNKTMPNKAMTATTSRAR